MEPMFFSNNYYSQSELDSLNNDLKILTEYIKQPILYCDLDDKQNHQLILDKNSLLYRINKFVLNWMHLNDTYIVSKEQITATHQSIETLDLAVKFAENNISNYMKSPAYLDFNNFNSYCIKTRYIALREFSDDLTKHLEKLNSKQTPKSQVCIHAEKPYEIKTVCDQELILLKEKDKKGNNVLYEALYKGDLEIIKYFCDKDPTLLKDNEGANALFLAISKGHLEIVKFLCDKDPTLLKEKDNDGANALHIAASNGEFEVVRFLCEKDPSLIKEKTNQGANALHHAAVKGHLKIVRFLCDKDTTLVKEKDKEGSNALYCAVGFKRLDVVEFLCEKAPILSKEKNLAGNNPLHAAVTRGDLETVRILCYKNPTLLYETTKQELNVLHLAAAKEDLEMVKFLFDMQPGLIKGKTILGFNILHMAAKTNKNLKVIKFLCDIEPKLLKEKDNDGTNALHWAAKFGHLESIIFFCEREPSLLIEKTNDGVNALFWAIAFGHLDSVKFLYDREPKLLMEKTNLGDNALHCAAGGGFIEIVKFLIRIYPNFLNQQCNEGRLPVQIAKIMNHTEVMRYMIIERLKLSTNSNSETKMSPTVVSNLNTKEIIAPTSKLEIATKEKGKIDRKKDFQAVSIDKVKVISEKNLKHKAKELKEPTIAKTDNPLTLVIEEPEVVRVNELIATTNLDISKKSNSKAKNLSSEATEKDVKKKGFSYKKAKKVWESTVGMSKEEKAEKREERKRLNRESMSQSLSITESQQEFSYSMRSEQSEMEEGSFKALVNALFIRDKMTLSQVELDKKIIVETLLELEAMKIIKITRSKSNKNKVRATLIGPFTGPKRPSLTVHMHDHDLPWEKQKRVRDNLFNFLKGCGIVPSEIMQKFSNDGNEGLDAGEG